MLLNLLTNAAKYTPPGGLIEVTGKREGDSHVFTVRDNGMGIAPERLPAMFELFAQGERSIARSEGGLGIGLTIVKKLTEMHGGRIDAESEGRDKGSKFSIVLPAAEPPLKVASTDAGKGGATTDKLRIMVVDDNRDTAEGLARLLKRDGHEVIVAYDGHAAVAKAHEACPQVVLLDIGLPGIDGYEVAGRLREEAACSRALVIALSGYGQDEDRRRSRAAGFDFHLVKPVSFDELRALVTIAHRPPSPAPHLTAS
jgi:CheY-like chemotaxis protein